VVLDLAAGALAGARERREVILRVNPGDAEVARRGEGVLARILARAPLVIRDDLAVPAGGAIVETECGRIDATIQVQLDLLEHALRAAIP
jgi:flagellar biosynthesis/type III secretory pathway protein FliH